MKKNYSEKMIVQEWMVTALIELMKEYKFDEITITQIAQKSGVSRMTYYRNYVSKEDILHSYAEYLTQLLAQKMREVKDLTVEKYWRLLFVFLYEKRSFITALYASGKCDLILDITNENISSLTAADTRFASYYAVGGFYNLMRSWIQNGYKPSVNEMAQRLTALTRSTLTDSIIESYMKTFDKLSS